MTANIVTRQPEADDQVVALTVTPSRRCPYCRQDLQSTDARCRACGAPSPIVAGDAALAARVQP